MQHIGDSQIDISGNWHNQSVHIFTAQAPGAAGLSITINRDRLPFATTLAQYAHAQCELLEHQLKGYDLIAARELEIDGRPARQYEFGWETDDAGPMHQVLICVANGPLLLNLTASCGGRMTDVQLAEAQRILQSLRFEPDTPAGLPPAATKP